MKTELTTADSFWDEVMESIEPNTTYFWVNYDTCVPFIGSLQAVHFNN